MSDGQLDRIDECIGDCQQLRIEANDGYAFVEGTVEVQEKTEIEEEEGHLAIEKPSS